MATHKDSAVEGRKQEPQTLAVVLYGEHPCMSEPLGVCNTQSQLSGHLPRGEESLCTQAFEATLEAGALTQCGESAECKRMSLPAAVPKRVQAHNGLAIRVTLQ